MDIIETHNFKLFRTTKVVIIYMSIDEIYVKTVHRTMVLRRVFNYISSLCFLNAFNACASHNAFASKL